jgi:hypothetical protein
VAQQTIVKLVDDIDGTVLADGKGETVLFSLDGVSYEIDLSGKNANRLRSDLSAYIAAARRVSRGRSARGRGTSSGASGQTQAIRAWARANGYEVSDRGRIPSSLREAYETSR